VPRLNEHYLNLRASDLFSEIKQRTKAFGEAHPGVRLINLGIGDVTQPLPPAVIRALHEATDEMARAETFRGYGPYAGFAVYGGRNAPYASLRTPAGRSSWDFFDAVLAKAHVVGVPGSGFGPSGEGYFRFSAFGSRAETEEAVQRIATCL